MKLLLIVKIKYIVLRAVNSIAFLSNCYKKTKKSLINGTLNK